MFLNTVSLFEVLEGKGTLSGSWDSQGSPKTITLGQPGQLFNASTLQYWDPNSAENPPWTYPVEQYMNGMYDGPVQISPAPKLPFYICCRRIVTLCKWER